MLFDETDALVLLTFAVGKLLVLEERGPTGGAFGVVVEE